MHKDLPTTRLTRRLIKAWLKRPDLDVSIPRGDGSGTYEPAKILRLVAITQPVEHPLYVDGLSNNLATVDVDVEDLRRLNSTQEVSSNGTRSRHTQT